MDKQSGEVNSELADILMRAFGSWDGSSPQTDLSITHLRLSSKQVLDGFSSIVNNHPEFFYIKGFSVKRFDCSGSVDTVTIAFDTQYNLESLDEFDQITREFLSGLNEGWDDSTRALYCHEYLVGTCSYVSNRYSAYDALVNHNAACEGYSLAYKYLCGLAGLDCSVVTSESMRHAFNLVFVDGLSYLVDCTWDDPNLGYELPWNYCLHDWVLCSYDSFTEKKRGFKTHTGADWVDSMGRDVDADVATSDLYDSAFWTKIGSSVLQPIDGKFAYINLEPADWVYPYTYVALYDPISHESENLIQYDVMWASETGGFWEGMYSQVAAIDDYLAVSLPGRIERVNLDGSSSVMHSATDKEQAEGLIYGLRYNREAGALLYSFAHMPPCVNYQYTTHSLDLSIDATGMTLSEHEIALDIGKKHYLNRVFSPDNATVRETSFISSNPKVARVSSAGTVTGVGAGEATITATHINGFSDSCKVKVISHGSIYNSGKVVAELDESIEECVLGTSSTTYNPGLSYYLSCMARAAYSKSDVKKSLSSMGFGVDDESEFYSDYNNDPTVAYSIGIKGLSDGTKLALITIRGSVGWSWASNFLLVPEFVGFGKHSGFQGEADQVYGKLTSLLGGLKKSNVKYVITGHSQGAAVGNLLAVRLHDEGVPAANVYDYNFACPNVACYANPLNWNPGGAHDNIFNIGNVEDPVTFLPGNVAFKFVSGPSTWGKFGRSYWFVPSADNHGELSIEGSAHDMSRYVRALSQREPISSFVESPSGSFWRRIGVWCPVDAVVYDDDGKPVAGVVDGEERYYKSEFGEVVVLTDGDGKVFLLPEGGDYDVRLTATGEGEMTYDASTVDLASQEAVAQKAFESVQLTEGKEMRSEVGGGVEISDVKLYVMGSTGEPVAEVLEDGAEIGVGNAPSKSDLVAYAGKAKAAGFTDLDPGAWYMNAGGTFPESQTLYLDYAIAKGLMSGYSGTTRFAPDDDVSRAMVATIIYRSATGKTADTTDNDVTTKFADVAANQWYSAAVAWCAEKGIVTGYAGTGRFGPDDPVTREQLATMVGRYCQKVHGMAPAGEDVSRFKDAASISAFAKEGVAFCAANNIVSGIGDTGNFQPQGNATRCQMSKIIAVTARMLE